MRSLCVQKNKRNLDFRRLRYEKTLITSSVIVLLLLVSTKAYAATYHVSQRKLGSWSLNYNVVANHNKVTAIKNLSIKPTGSIDTKTITYSGGDAHIQFTRHIQAIRYRSSIKISVSRSKVYVTD